MNLLHVNLNKIFMKKTKLLSKNIIKKNGIDLCSAILFSVWINKRLLDSHIYFCIQSVVIYCFG